MARYADTGLGTKDKTNPRSVKLPPDIDAVVGALDGRSQHLRRWIIEGMLRDGLISAEVAAKYLGE